MCRVFAVARVDRTCDIRWRLSLERGRLRLFGGCAYSLQCIAWLENYCMLCGSGYAVKAVFILFVGLLLSRTCV